MTKKILCAVTVFFFAAMLFLSLFARKLHESSLPRVTAAYPGRYAFQYEFADENGEIHISYEEKTAVPRSIAEHGIFVIYSAERNGTKRYFVRLADAQTGAEADGYVEVVSGLAPFDKIAAESSGELFDGCEVIPRDSS